MDKIAIVGHSESSLHLSAALAQLEAQGYTVVDNADELPTFPISSREYLNYEAIEAYTPTFYPEVTKRANSGMNQRKRRKRARWSPNGKYNRK